MPKSSHRIAARQAEMARRKKKQHKAGGPAEPAAAEPSGPVEGAAAQPAAAIPAVPASAEAAPAPAAAVAPAPAPMPRPAAAKVGAAYARFLNEQQYFVKDLTVIGVVTGLIVVAFVVLGLTIR
ncbi:MAG: hypothetical protein HYX97_05075 [Chloroflexi bacterium]|nr:hypothetical protein [Chloroflexota bacterium]